MDRNSYEALRQRAAWIDLSGRGKIRAAGDDRVRLLHSMCTANIQELIPGAGCYAFFLTAQGRIIADANVFSMSDYVLLDTEPDTKQRVYDHLEKFIIADDVVLRDFTDDTATLGVEGPQAMELLQHLGIPVAHLPCSIADWAHSNVAHVSYTGQPGYSLFVPVEHKQDIVDQLQGAGIPQADMATAEAVRIENGRARYGVDFSEANIPQETLQMHAIHPNKGCYLGQEIVERVRSRGHVNKVLCSLEIEGSEPPSSHTKIQADGKEVGEITSAAFSPAKGKVAALGIVRAEAVNGPLSVDGLTARARPATK